MMRHEERKKMVLQAEADAEEETNSQQQAELMGRVQVGPAVLANTVAIARAAPLKSGSAAARLLCAILLPCLCALLLPTLRLAEPPSVTSSGGEFLAALVRLPLERFRLQSSVLLAQAREIATKNDLQEEETHMLLLAPAEHRASYQPAAYAAAPTSVGEQTSAADAHAEYGATGETGGGEQQSGGVVSSTAVAPLQQADATALAETGANGGALQARSDLPAVRALNVKCEKNHMTVNIVFDRPFYGMVFSKGHYNDQKCVHLAPNSGQTSVNFDIHLGKCGMSSSDASTSLQSNSQQQQQQQPNGVYIENTIIIQYDPLVQEIFDQARKLRCTWYDYYEKSVTFRPYNVDMLDAVTANFLGDNIQCWMQIQVGKGPWSSEVAGIVKIGQTMTMVLAIKDDENRFDMLVRNCVAHDGKHQPIQLVDEYGCVARPKIMGKFQKVRNFGPAATVVSYAHFQAFKFPDSMSVHFQCVIQVCRYECPEPVCNQAAELAGGGGGNVGGGNVGGGNLPTGAADYAASGTEMVAIKEAPASYFAAGAPHANLSHVNLKLDESQGRVQVKLDTSMMAGLNGRSPGPQEAASSSGPLPPHLLHMAAGEHNAAGGRNYLVAGSFQRPGAAAPMPTGGATSAHLTSSAQRHQNHHNQQQHQQMAGRSQQPLVAPSSGSSQPHPGIMHYSPQYGASSTASTRRSGSTPAANAFASRLGELALEAAGEGTQMTPPYEADYPSLSLIGSPRGLKLEPHQRVKRDQRDQLANDSRARKLRSHPDSSTSVQTQRTIQVVSPDDVAFSLLDPSEENAELSARQLPPVATWRQLPVSPTTVCFTTTRFLWGLLVTLAVLVSSIVIVAYIILRQRAQLDQKMASLFVPAREQAASSNSTEHLVAYCASDSPNETLQQQQQQHLRQQMLAHQQQNQQQQQHNGIKLNSSPVPNLCHATSAAAAVLAQQRQRDEQHQRETYLSRLYSQFAPANYWR